MKKPDQLHRIAAKVAIVQQIDPVAFDQKTVDFAPAQTEPGQTETRLPPVLLFQGGAKNTGQITHVLGDEKIVLHEALFSRRQGRG